MNVLQEKILYTLKAIKEAQITGSQYFTEGTSSDNFGTIASYQAIEAEIAGLITLGYIQSFNLSTGKKGLFLTQAGLDWVIADKATKDAQTATAAAAQKILDDRAFAKALKDALSADGVLFRALVLVLVDELNAHADKENSILTAIDSGSTLAQVKTNIAAIADYPQRTIAQLKTAMENKIDAGTAD